jgi:hypothetical protein
MAIVLIGREFWQPMIDWVRGTMLTRFGTISPEDMDLFTVTDDPRIAVDTVCDFYEHHREEAGIPPTEQEMTRHPQERMTAEGTVFGVPPFGPRHHPSPSGG